MLLSWSFCANWREYLRFFDSGHVATPPTSVMNARRLTRPAVCADASKVSDVWTEPEGNCWIAAAAE
jgi:hypothetical protein